MMMKRKGLVYKKSGWKGREGIIRYIYSDFFWGYAIMCDDLQ